MIRRINKKAQEEKPKFFMPAPKKAQEEIAGFGIILVVIAVIALVFISLSMNKNRGNSDEKDYEVSSFLNALMEKTTDCEKNSVFLAVKDLIFECGRNYVCANEESSCDVLNETLESAMEDNWDVEKGLVKGYSLIAYYEGEIMVNETAGNETFNSRGALQDYAKSGEMVQARIEIFD